MMNTPQTKKLSSITAFFPAYNDAGTITNLIKTVDKVLPDLCDSYEIIAIDDGSQDGTGELLDRLGGEIPSLLVIHHDKNRGYGATLRSGFSAATKDWIFYTDGDGQYDPFELVNLVAAVNDTINVVNGYKIHRNDPIIRIWIGALYHRIIDIFFTIPVRDVDCDFRLINHKKLSEVRLLSNSGAICVELIKKLEQKGCVFTDVPVHHFSRKYGHSQFFRIKPIFSTFLELARLYKTRNESYSKEQP
jgi:glycosyltransferase involved in cell wall biosynthesis